MFEPSRAPGRARRDGHRAGDPAKAARAILAWPDSPNPLRHLLLGSDAPGFVRDQLADVESRINAWQKLAVSTDFER
ncbi:hypothetical protein [Paraburkholderia solisilvae]|uniref:Short-chain dehydrogenase/reductase SDR n=1 Tax=Paraburkholderia solisilvae TaxID=624376 RepID=A0A6J5D6M3_9BURK|nr:hypothetical protein [Paraburkholderia solisilvae]CAB3749051.1 hypothetical protein LMG29739_00680 [Paraburkholderia solisilvae]